MTLHYAHGPSGGLTACNLRVAPPMTPPLETTADWGAVECEECRYVGNQWSKNLSVDTERRALVHHSESISSGTDCGARADGINSILSNLGWDKVTCWDCLDGKPGAVRRRTPVDHDKAHTPAPAYAHDCEACVYLDTVVRDEREHDIYFCPGSSKPTIVVRFSAQGPDYDSGLAFADKDPLIALGVVQALKRKLIRFEDVLKFL